MTTTFDPEIWLETTLRGLKEYAEQQFDNALVGPDGPVGLEAYEIVMEFPGATLDASKVPMRRTVVHFEIDDIVTSTMGFGSGGVEEIYDEATGTVLIQEAQRQRILFDLGIWATDASGGSTSRARARQILTTAFGGNAGAKRLCEFTDGGEGQLELLNFSGGRFLMDRINDMGVYRMVDCTLEIGVYSRTPKDAVVPMPAIITIDQDPFLLIYDVEGLIAIDGYDMTKKLPLTVNLDAYRGDTWKQDFRFLMGTAPKDLTNSTVASQARDQAGNVTDLIVTVTDATDGRIELKLPTGLLAGSYNYDIEVTDLPTVTTWVRGALIITEDITNAA